MLRDGRPLVSRIGTRYVYQSPTAYPLSTALLLVPVDAWHAGGWPGGEGIDARYRAHRAVYTLAGRLLSVLFGLRLACRPPDHPLTETCPKHPL